MPQPGTRFFWGVPENDGVYFFEAVILDAKIYMSRCFAIKYWMPDWIHWDKCISPLQ